MNMLELCQHCGHQRRFHESDRNTGQARCTDCLKVDKKCQSYVGLVGGI